MLLRMLYQILPILRVLELQTLLIIFLLLNRGRCARNRIIVSRLPDYSRHAKRRKTGNTRWLLLLK